MVSWVTHQLQFVSVPHIDNLCNTVRRLVGLLHHRFSKHADTNTLFQLYKSYIRIDLEYCSVVCDPYLLGNIESLETVQCFTLYVRLKSWSISREELYTQSNIQPLVKRRSNARLCHLLKIVHNLIVFPISPLKFRDLYYNSRNSYIQLRNILARTSQFQKSFFLALYIALWNSLPHCNLSSV